MKQFLSLHLGSSPGEEVAYNQQPFPEQQEQVNENTHNGKRCFFCLLCALALELESTFPLSWQDMALSARGGYSHPQVWGDPESLFGGQRMFPASRFLFGSGHP